MKYFELDKDEQKVLEEIEQGKWTSVTTRGEKSRYQTYVFAALQKTKSINIRLSEDVLMRLRANALHEGIPYQTYIASLLHKHVRGSLKAT